MITLTRRRFAPVARWRRVSRVFREASALVDAVAARLGYPRPVRLASACIRFILRLCGLAGWALRLGL